MFDGLIEYLMGWLALAWCWALDKIVSLAAAMMQLVAAMMPSVAVPGWLDDLSYLELYVQALHFFFPMSVASWLLTAVIGIEIIHFMVLVLYRAFMDLL